jgi:hypothetical protein
MADKKISDLTALSEALADGDLVEIENISKTAGVRSEKAAMSDILTYITNEQGAWTPQISYSSSNGDTSYSVQVGYYVKIDKVVHLFGYLNWGETTASGSARISNLPFNGSSIASLIQGGGIRADNLTGISGGVSWEMGVSATVIGLHYSGTGTGAAITEANTGAANNVLRFSITYLTD